MSGQTVEAFEPPGGLRPFTPPSRARTAVPVLSRGIAVEITDDPRPMTVAELRIVLDQMPEEASVLCDGHPLRVAGGYGQHVLLDTGFNLPPACPGCCNHGCDGRCREA